MASQDAISVWHVRNSDRFGGPERLIVDQCAHTTPGFGMTVASFATGDAPHAFLDAAAARGIRTRRLPQGSSYDPRLVRRLRDAVRADAPDVLVGHDYKANLLLHLAARKLGIPRVAIVHGYTGENRKIRFFEALDRRVLKRLDAVVVVADAMCAMLLKRGVPADRIHLVPNAIDTDAVSATAAAARDDLRAAWDVTDHTVLLALGRLSPEKGQDVLLEALARMPAEATRPLTLVLVGDGATRGALEAQAERLGLTGRVRFLGWRDDPHACLGAADAVVLPSRTEGLPLALLEAMAAERPVVATRVGGVPDALADGEAGWLATPDDAGSLADALTAMLADADARAAKIAAGRARVTAHYSAARQARALEAVYAAVTARA
ncbi:MAG: glycosyltransferase [Planctomycetota bacterium]|nr:glycosyltransferase [Planctomycetota bacterium]